MSTIKTRTIKGGEFIIRETLCEDIFIPEEFDEEQLMIFGKLRFSPISIESIIRKKA